MVETVDMLNVRRQLEEVDKGLCSVGGDNSVSHDLEVGIDGKLELVEARGSSGEPRRTGSVDRCRNGVQLKGIKTHTHAHIHESTEQQEGMVFGIEKTQHIPENHGTKNRLLTRLCGNRFVYALY